MNLGNGPIAFEVMHLLSAGVLLVSFALLYQRRIQGVFNAFAAHAVLVALAAAWQAFVQDKPDLYGTAAIALFFKGIFIPLALRWIVERLGIERQVETVIGIGPTMLAGLALTVLAILLVLPVTSAAAAVTRESLALALSVVLLGLLMMITRRNAVTQVVGLMTVENGLVLAAVGVRGMPFVVEMSVAFAVLIAFLVFGMFFFRIRERFDSLDVERLDQARGERR